ncbi:transcription initiation factor tfiid subunit [Anaeramoeba flamelloides]|uniref:Transcription initiation factor tfiid subunit n=1 Tax=Anaeramoeba flamelloides TaxID=1746091 RepID=A0AAV8A9S1_9EUKA|nr:transcription initiation factor tfiid subunit [Anaeramoeba flamelloides]
MIGIATESYNSAKGGNVDFEDGEVLFNIQKIEKGKLTFQKLDQTNGTCPLFFVSYPQVIAIANDNYYPRNTQCLSFKTGEKIYLDPSTTDEKYWFFGVLNGKKGYVPRFAVDLEKAVVVGEKIFSNETLKQVKELFGIDFQEILKKNDEEVEKDKDKEKDKEEITKKQNENEEEKELETSEKEIEKMKNVEEKENDKEKEKEKRDKETKEKEIEKAKEEEDKKKENQKEEEKGKDRKLYLYGQNLVKKKPRRMKKNIKKRSSTENELSTIQFDFNNTKMN